MAPVSTKKKVAAKPAAPSIRARRTAGVKPAAPAQPKANGKGDIGAETRAIAHREAVVNKSGLPKLGKGGLASMVIEHMRKNPKLEFTPSELGRKLNRSSGAVANALEKFTAEGEVVLTSEKPKRYRVNAKKRATRGAATR